MQIDPTNQTAHQNYQLLIASILPRPIAFITSLGPNACLNAAPFSFFSIVSTHPPMVSVSISRKKGQLKDTARNSLLNQEFVLHLVDEPILLAVNETARNLPPHESELTATSLTVIPSVKLKTPAIKEAKIRFECRLHQHLILPSPESPTSDLLLAEIIYVHVDEAIYKDGKISLTDWQPISRLAGHDYGQLGNSFTLPRPN